MKPPGCYDHICPFKQAGRSILKTKTDLLQKRKSSSEGNNPVYKL